VWLYLVDRDHRVVQATVLVGKLGPLAPCAVNDVRERRVVEPQVGAHACRCVRVYAGRGVIRVRVRALVHGWCTVLGCCYNLLRLDLTLIHGKTERLHLLYNLLWMVLLRSRLWHRHRHTQLNWLVREVRLDQLWLGRRVLLRSSVLHVRLGLVLRLGLVGTAAAVTAAGVCGRRPAAVAAQMP